LEVGSHAQEVIHVCYTIRYGLVKPTKLKPVYKDPLNEYDTTGAVNTLKSSMRSRGWVLANANRGHYIDAGECWVADGGWKRARAFQEGEAENWVDPSDPEGPPGR
jgi:hypothetical protein